MPAPRSARSRQRACPCSPPRTRRRIRSTAAAASSKSPCSVPSSPLDPCTSGIATSNRATARAEPPSRPRRASTSVSSPPPRRIRAHRHACRRGDEPIDVLVRSSWSSWSPVYQAPDFAMYTGTGTNRSAGIAAIACCAVMTDTSCSTERLPKNTPTLSRSATLLTGRCVSPRTTISCSRSTPNCSCTVSCAMSTRCSTSAAVAHDRR